MSEAGCGPIDAHTPATFGGLRRAFAGLDVQPPSDDGSAGYHVLRGGEPLLEVVPTEGTVCYVHATSAAILVAGKSWRVGAMFRDAAQLSNCGCWREKLTCWRLDAHVAVTFARACDYVKGNDPSQLRTLDGLAVDGMIWSPVPYGHVLDFDRCVGGGEQEDQEGRDS
jgi:hypothetical protein